MAGYTRQSTAEIVSGADVSAAPLNAEFNALQSAFSSSTGHTHDGTTGNGPQVSLSASVTGRLPLANIVQVGSMKVLGNTSGSTANAAEVSVLDEDNMVTNSATAIPTQQSVKAYVDTYATMLAGAQTITGLKTISRGTAGTAAGYMEFKPTDYATGKPMLFIDSEGTADDWTIGLWDGTTGGGSIDLYVTTLTHNGIPIVTTTGSQTLTNKTLTSPTVNTPTITTPTITDGSWTGGSWTGGTDLAVADGGTGASDASGARTNLGLVIGTNVQAYDATLASLASLGTAADKIAYTTGVDTWAETAITTFGRSLIDDADASTARTTLGLTIGTNVQAYDATLADISGMTIAAGDILYGAGADNLSQLPIGTANYVLRVNSGATAPEWALPSYFPGSIFGLTLSNNTTDPNNDIDIATGFATSDDSAYTSMQLSSPITKRIDDAWAVGSGNGGLDTGSVALSTWYHVWLILRPDTGVVDVLFSTSATSPTMPTNYTKKRRIGSVYYTAATGLGLFKQIGDEFLWYTAILDYDGTQGTSNANRVLSVPTGVNVEAMIRAYGFDTTTWEILLYSINIDFSGPDRTTYGLPTLFGVASSGNTQTLRITTDTNARIRSRADAAGRTLRIATDGWIDTRGRLA